MSHEIAQIEPDPQRDHQIYQCLVSGLAPYDVAVHFGVPLEYVLPIRDELPEFMKQRGTPPALRKELALARTDMAMRALLPAVEKGDREAIDLMLKVQKREAAMTGLDAPVKSDVNQTIRIEAPWMSANRLSYMLNRTMDENGKMIDVIPTPTDAPAGWRPEEAREPRKLPFVPVEDPPEPGTARAVEASLAAKAKAKGR